MDWFVPSIAPAFLTRSAGCCCRLIPNGRLGGEPAFAGNDAMDLAADSHLQSSALLAKLRATDVTQRVAADRNPWEAAILAEFARSGVAFTATSPAMESRFYDAVAELIT